jgi:hypothetical protein
MFRRIEGKKFDGHYTNAFGSVDDMLAGRDDLIRLASLAGAADRVAPLEAPIGRNPVDGRDPQCDVLRS